MPRCLASVGFVRHSTKIQLAVVAAGGPDLLAVDDPLIAIEHGASAQIGEIRAAVGLAVALTPTMLPGDDLGQEVALLLLCAALDDGVAHHRDAEAVVVTARRHACGQELLGEHDTLHLAEPGAAIFDRPRHSQQLVLGQERTPLLDELLPGLLGEIAHSAPVGRQVLGQERLDLLPVVLRLFGVGGIHGRAPLLLRR